MNNLINMRQISSGLRPNYRTWLVGIILMAVCLVVPFQYRGQTVAPLKKLKKRVQPSMASHSGSKGKKTRVREVKKSGKGDDAVSISTGEAVVPSSYDGDVRDLPQN